jgi:hypothetical protein
MTNQVACRRKQSRFGDETASIPKILGWPIADQAEPTKNSFLPAILEPKRLCW